MDFKLIFINSLWLLLIVIVMFFVTGVVLAIFENFDKFAKNKSLNNKKYNLSKDLISKLEELSKTGGTDEKNKAN